MRRSSEDGDHGSTAQEAATPPWHQHLPDELIEDILARMPAKSVLRCRCLSRAWSAALSSYAFVDRHLDLANRRRGQFPSLCFLPDSAAASTVYAWTPEHGKGVFTPLMAVPHNTRNGILAAVTRPCRGLFLLRSVAARLYYLCNPSVGQITAALPDGRMPAGHRCPGREYASFGLGYDARARAHKVVRLLYHDSRPAGCDIYDVPGPGHWRPAAGGAIPPEHVRMNQMGVFVQGHVHWVTMTACGARGEAIVSFSMAGEEFGHVAPLPVKVVEGVRLTELAGCLCLVSAPHSPRSPRRCIDIWLLTDDAARAWEKHWHIDQAKLPALPPEMGGRDFMLNGVTPLALVDGGRRILFVSEEYQVAAYCLATGTLEELVRGFPGRGHRGGHHHLLVPYEESLVPAGRPFEDVLFSPPPARSLAMALRRLPARVLGRLKTVCRSWRAMIESDRFVASHNAFATAAAAASPVAVVFVSCFGTTESIPAAFLDRAGSSPVVSLVAACSGGADPPLSTSRVVCRRPCHGLLLLSNQYSDHCALCNPVTGDVNSFVFSGKGHGCAGLGYDPSREEHVLVRLVYTSRCFETREYAMECEVWPLRDLRPRTLAPSSRPPIPAAVDVPPVHVAGKMYWPGEPRLGAAAGGDNAAAAAILAFDVSTETFEVVAAPPVRLLDVGSGDRMILAELAGKKLCAVHLSASTETVTMWVNNDDGAGAWAAQHVMRLGRWPEFSPRSAAELVVPVAVDSDGRVLLDTGKALGYYDARSRSLETVCSLKSKLGDRHGADGLFFIAAVSEDSLFRPYDRSCRLW